LSDIEAKKLHLQFQQRMEQESDKALIVEL